MKQTALAVGIAVGIALSSLSVPQGHATEVDPDGAGWRIINQDPKGNLLYLAPATMKRTADGFLRVWVKFETRARNSPSPMLFLNELDCARGLIKRIEVKLYRPTCAGSGDPTQGLSFAGKWDRPAVGIEEHLREAVCREESSKGRP